MPLEEPNLNILFIENSATLRYGLQKQLTNENYSFTITSSYIDGIDKLNTASIENNLYDLIIVGWPVQTDPSADELFALLETPQLSTLPVLVMAADPDSATHTWVIRRAHTAILDWRNHVEIGVTVQKLLAVREEPVRDEIEPIEQKERIKILFVDDSPSIRVYYRRLLTRQGYHVDVASSVDEGLDKAQENNYDLAIIDYFMPDANGDVLVNKLHHDPATQNVATAIFTSTYMDQVIEDSLNAGAVDCMFKNEADALFLARVSAMSRSVLRAKSSIAEKQRLQSILNSVGDGVYGVSNSGEITFVNPTTRVLLGYDENNELLGKSAYDLFHHCDELGNPVKKDNSRLQSAYGTKNILRNWETVFWSKTGNSLPVECTVYPQYVNENLEGSVVAFRDITERKTLEERLRWQATHDSLTELFNRRYFEEQLERRVELLKRTKTKSAVLFIDIDRFKYINDTAGHAAGDKLLVSIGQRLRERLRETDILARLGGDEFAILMCNVDEDKLFKPADGFRDIVSAGDFEHLGKLYKIDISVGVTVFDEDALSPGNILAEADVACNTAKLKGGNQTHIYSREEDYREEMDMELGWSFKLRDALDNNKFILRYQPIVPISSIDFNALNGKDNEKGQIWEQVRNNLDNNEASFEVLIRMIDNDGNEIPPGFFIPTAERFHMMPEIDYWVIENSFMKLAEIRQRWPKGTLSINVSGHTLCHKDFLETVKKGIAKYKIPTDEICFEITETTDILDMKLAQNVIHVIKSMGCRFALDDFGTGFSSFSHLKILPVDSVKIDGMFVKAMAHDPIDHAMVKSVNDIAHCLGHVTIAEYVENISTLKLLRDCGVDYVQGFVIAEPLKDPVDFLAALPHNVHVMK
ncbi:MAG: EAL domain-containing protein [Gammaproteobacteria bacterium]|nr:EAL domain-containing protein [Gammaproteobacteria bacterium]